jgi:membrane-bound lytic murein transglycosylase D
VQVAAAEAEPKAAQAATAEPAKPEVRGEAKGEAEAKAEAKAESRNPVVRIEYYIIKKGDTLFSLAKRFNVKAHILSAWNNMKTRVALKPGRRIIVSKKRVTTAG